MSRFVFLTLAVSISLLVLQVSATSYSTTIGSKSSASIGVDTNIGVDSRISAGSDQYIDFNYDAKPYGYGPSYYKPYYKPDYYKPYDPYYKPYYPSYKKPSTKAATVYKDSKSSESGYEDRSSSSDFYLDKSSRFNKFDKGNVRSIKGSKIDINDGYGNDYGYDGYKYAPTYRSNRGAEIVSYESNDIKGQESGSNFYLYDADEEDSVKSIDKKDSSTKVAKVFNDKYGTNAGSIVKKDDKKFSLYEKKSSDSSKSIKKDADTKYFDGKSVKAAKAKKIDLGYGTKAAEGKILKANRKKFFKDKKSTQVHSKKNKSFTKSFDKSSKSKTKFNNINIHPEYYHYGY